jgi:hypothetical protein
MDLTKHLDEATEKLASDLTEIFSGLTIVDNEHVFSVDHVEVEGTHRAVLRLLTVHGAEVTITAHEGYPIRIERRILPADD